MRLVTPVDIEKKPFALLQEQIAAFGASDTQGTNRRARVRIVVGIISSIEIGPVWRKSGGIGLATWQEPATFQGCHTYFFTGSLLFRACS